MSYEGTHWACGHERKDNCDCDEQTEKRRNQFAKIKPIPKPNRKATP